MTNQSFKNEFQKRCLSFSLNVLHLSHHLDKSFENKIILHQLIRSATSIGANIVEGSSAVSKKDFINFFHISYKSASETLYWLALLKEINPHNKQEVQSLDEECEQLKKLLGSIILNTKKNESKNS